MAKRREPIPAEDLLAQAEEFLAGAVLLLRSPRLRPHIQEDAELRGRLRKLAWECLGLLAVAVPWPEAAEECKP